MSKYFKMGLALSGIILFGAGCAKGGSYSSTTMPASESSTPEVVVETVTTPPAVPGEAVVEYTDGTFNPSSLRILVGTKVNFVNKGTKEVWPASGRHPTHEICPGFDALRGLAAGEVYSYTFPQAAECPFHNHLAPGEKGSIEVQTAE